MKTPEQTKAELQLEWMRNNLPRLNGPTTPVIRRRRKVLTRLLSKLYVDADGCIHYPSKAKIPIINWPMNTPWKTDRRRIPNVQRSYCQWPGGGCKRPPVRTRTTVNSKRFIYCMEPDPVTGKVHDSRNAHTLRRTNERKQNTYVSTTADKAIAHLLLELYAPQSMENVKAVKSTCGKRTCVSPSHYYDQRIWARKHLKESKIRARYTRDEVREAVRLRYEESLYLKDIMAKTGIPIQALSYMCSGRTFANWTEDLRVGKVNPDGRSVMSREQARAVVLMKLADPTLSYREIARRMDIACPDTVSGIIKGKWYSKHTEDLRSNL